MNGIMDRFCVFWWDPSLGPMIKYGSLGQSWCLDIGWFTAMSREIAE